MADRVYLCLGSNLGNRQKNLEDAGLWIEKTCSVIRSSSIYETAPWGFIDQPNFLNQVLEISTPLTAPDLLSYLKEGEEELGRRESVRYGPRLIDMDILFYDDLDLVTPFLTIPHPRISERAFVLVPMIELAPDFIHPINKTKLVDMLALIDSSGVKITDIHPYKGLNNGSA